MLTFDSSVQYVKGVGPKRAATLAQAGIHTVRELLRYKPFRYEDRTQFRAIAELRPDEEAVIRAQVLVTGQYLTPMKRMRIFEITVGDDSGSIQVKFFNQPYLSRVFHRGQQVILFGVPKHDPFTYGLTVPNPEFEIVEDSANDSIHTGRVVPVYRRIGPLTTRIIRQVIATVLAEMPNEVEDALPAPVLRKFHFPDVGTALRQVHFPEAPDGRPFVEWFADVQEGRADFQRRLAFEEFFVFQLGLRLFRRSRRLITKQRTNVVTDAVREKVKAVLPFHPTVSQKRVLKEIVEDLCSDRIMNRLLQGDVGSGKTIVALQAAVVVMENRGQAAFMAPTEILAEQHYANINEYLSKTPYRAALLTGNVKGKQRTAVLNAIRSGEIRLLVGTHALIQKGVDFQDLALVIIDEQHRFGVAQRALLQEKGTQPDTLIMTATPIPRSLALTLYGDLDVSVINELPPGRQPVRTIVRAGSERAEIYDALRDGLRNGHQAYIVYPLIEQSDKLNLRAAKDMAEHLQADVLPEYRIGLMHGRLKSEEKDELMRLFKAGEVQVMVATTVIEVGIDVANASIMIIEHADRFGLSQLHQLRGRIGRGLDPGLCILVADDARSPEALERLGTMCRTSDGFKIAEKDLELRGPGEFLGTRQSGIPSFVFANLVRDRDLLEHARSEADNYLRDALDKGGDEGERIGHVFRQMKDRHGLFYTG